MKMGTIVKLDDGRVGTVVYNGLDGVGIKWGKHNITEKDIAPWGMNDAPEDYEWYPDAMLREDYPSSEGLECVGRYTWEVCNDE